MLADPAESDMKTTSPSLFEPNLKLVASVVLGLLIIVGAVAFKRSLRQDPMRLDDQRHPLVVFVLIDALRRDHLSTMGYARHTTPNLDRLAAEGFTASGMLTNSSQTAPSVASMFTSTEPHAHGVQYHPRTLKFGNDGRSRAPLLAEENLTVAEVLSSHGYATAAVVTNPWIRKEFGFAQGFDRYVESPCHRLLDLICDGAEINKAAVALFHEHSEEKTFLYLHYLDVHNPYAHRETLPPVFRKPPGRMIYENGIVKGVSEQDIVYSRDAYDDGLLYTDQLIGELARELEAVSTERDVLLVVTSDHGEEFLEHGGLGHGTTLYPELIESFAIFWRPDGRLERERDEGLSGAIDIAPTLLDLLELEKPSEMVGRSLLGPSRGETVLSELANKKAAIKDHWGLIRDLDSQKEELVAYGGASEPEPSAELVAALESTLDSLEIGETPAKSMASDPAVVEQLKALGYVE